MKQSTPPCRWLNATCNWLWSSRKKTSLLMNSCELFWLNVIQSKPAVENQVYIWAYMRLQSPKKGGGWGQHVQLWGMGWRRVTRAPWNIKESLVLTVLGKSLLKTIQWLLLRRIQNQVCKWQYRGYDVVRELSGGNPPDVKDLSENMQRWYRQPQQQYLGA